MATETDGLLVEIGLTEKQYRQALARLEKQTVSSAKKSENAWKSSNNKIAGGMNNANKASNSFAKGGLRNVTMQLSQVAQQGAATGNYMQALAIQLPDLALGFGPLGIAIGAVAGGLATFAINAAGGVDPAKRLTDAISELESTISSVDEVIDLTGKSFAELAEDMGGTEDGIRGLIEARRNIGLRELADDANELSAALSAMYNGSAWLNVSRAEDLGNAFNLTTKETRQLAAMLDALGRAGSLGEQLAITEAMRASFVQMVGNIDQMTAAEFEFYSLVVDTEGALRKVLDRTEDLEGSVTNYLRAFMDAGAAISANLGPVDQLYGRVKDLATEAWSYVAAMAAGGSGEAGQRGDPRQFETDRYWKDKYFPKPERMSPTSSRSGGGGGGQSAQNDAMREAQRIYDETRTAAENYAIELERLNELLAAGYLDAETYGRAVDQLAEKYLGAGNAAKFWEEQRQSMESGIASAIASGESLTTVFQNLAKAIAEAAIQAALFGSGPLGSGGGLLGGFMGSIFPSANGNVFSGGSVVPFANGGVVGGPTLFPMRGSKTGLMGEAGPEAIMPLTRINGKLGVAAQAQSPQVNVAPPQVKVIVLDDPDKIGQYLSGSKGEREVMRIVDRNRGLR